MQLHADFIKAPNVLAGISMEGDDELLAEMGVKVAPQRDEWMTTLPPERKVSPLIQCSVIDKGVTFLIHSWK